MSYSDETSPPAIEPFGVVPAEDRMWAMIAHLFGALGYSAAVVQYAGPLVVYVAYKDKSKFVAFHALQTLYFHLAILAAFVAAFLIAVLTCGIGLFVVAPFLAALPVGALIYSIIGALQAHEGRLFEYWVVGKWARDQVGI